MTVEQEIRAYALAIAVLNNQGSFFKVQKDESLEDSVIELNDRQKAYLAAIEQYIAGKINRGVSDSGWLELRSLI